MGWWKEVCCPSPGITLSSWLHLSAQSENHERNHRVHGLHSHPPFWPTAGFLSRTQTLVWLRAMPFLKKLTAQMESRTCVHDATHAGLLSLLSYPGFHTPQPPLGERGKSPIILSTSQHSPGTYLLALIVLNARHVLTTETLPVTLRDHHPFLILQAGRQRPMEGKRYVQGHTATKRQKCA